MRRGEGKKDVQGSMFQVQRFNAFRPLNFELWISALVPQDPRLDCRHA
jgi:hypothetical protein